VKPFVIELADRNVTLARDGAVLVSAPSAVFDGSSTETTAAAGPDAVAPGKNAWHALRRQPRSTSSRHLGAVLTQSESIVSAERAAALVTAELAQHLAKFPPDAGERVWIAVPAEAEAGGLGTMLSIAQSLELKVDGFIDAASVTVSALATGRSALVLELGLHHAAVTAVDSGGQARRRRAVVSELGGLVELYEAWLTFISTAMVKKTRFDPFTNASTEQQLFDALPALTRAAAETGGTLAAVTNGDNRFEVSLSRDQFAEAAQPIYRELVRLLHSVRPAGADVAIVVPEPVAALPGLREALEQFVGCELIAVPDGFAALATSLLDLPASVEGETVRLLRRLPLKERKGLSDSVKREMLGRSGTRATPASHVLFEGRAFALGTTPLVVGRAPIAETHAAAAQSAPVTQVPAAPPMSALTLPDGLAGVSRRHCTFVRNGDELVLVDHSHFGTFVNNERVSERVRIHAGDKVRVGEPGVELSLISIGA
jgi:FHA domain-containing protein